MITVDDMLASLIYLWAPVWRDWANWPGTSLDQWAYWPHHNLKHTVDWADSRSLVFRPVTCEYALLLCRWTHVCCKSGFLRTTIKQPWTSIKNFLKRWTMSSKCVSLKVFSGSTWTINTSSKCVPLKVVSGISSKRVPLPVRVSLYFPIWLP